MRYIVWILFIAVSASSVKTQESDMKAAFRVGGGTSIPLYDSSVPGLPINDKVGFSFQSGFEFIVTPNMALFGEGHYLRNGADPAGPGSEEARLLVDLTASGLGGHAGLMIQSSDSPTIYGFVGGGFSRVKGNVKISSLSTSTAETGFSILGGLGLRFPVAETVQVFIEGRYLHPFVDGPANTIPIIAGLRLTPR